MLQIQTGSDNKILRNKSKEISDIDKERKVLISEMKEMVRARRGLGLAAPQVGVNIRLVVLNISHQHIKEVDGNAKSKRITMPEVLVNPRITFFSKEQVIMEEGCLSLPEIFGYVERSKEIEVVYDDENLERQKEKFDGLIARVIEHEVDHLDGILFIDKIISSKL